MCNIHEWSITSLCKTIVLKHVGCCEFISNAMVLKKFSENLLGYFPPLSNFNVKYVVHMFQFHSWNFWIFPNFHFFHHHVKPCIMWIIIHKSNKIFHSSQGLDLEGPIYITMNKLQNLCYKMHNLFGKFLMCLFAL